MKEGDIGGMKPGDVGDVCYPKPRKPEEVVGSKKYWYPVIGKAFVHKDRIDLRLDSLPLPLHWDGRLVIYVKAEDEDKDAAK